jgi:3-dehydroquinate dehydratase type I
MKQAKICAVVINNDLEAVKDVEPLVDLLEVRIDLIGDGWQELTKQLNRPWIACNRCAEEGGQWQGSEARRIEKLLEAIELGADMVDVELRTKNLEKITQVVKRRTTCLLSVHDFGKTPVLSKLKEIARRQMEAGADICKIVTTARSLEDNLTVLQLISETPDAKLASFAMGPLGSLSRVLSPLVGGEFTYASIERGKESAQGQLTVKELRQLYDMMKE